MATCRASNGHGSWSDSINLTIQNPDTVFSGTNTICFSTAGTFTGKPTGALEVTLSTKVIESCDASTNRLTITGHNMVTGELVYAEDGAGTLPTSTGTYATPSGTARYVRVVDANTITLHGSQYGATTGDHVVDWTGSGTGQLLRGIGTIVTGYLRSGKRCLIRGGETIEAYAMGEFFDYNLAVETGQLGSFGTGKATIRSRVGQNIITLPANNAANNIVIKDLILDNNGQSCLGISGVAKRWDGLTILRVEAHDSGSGDFSRCFVLNGVQWDAQNTVIQDCDLTDGVYQIFGTGEYFSILGNVQTHTHVGGGPEHNLRLTWVDKSLIAHNHLIDGGTTKTIFRIQGSGADGAPSQYCTVNFNWFQNINIPLAWPTMIGSSDSSASSNINDFRIECNFFDYQSWLGPYAMTVYCTHSIFSNNLFRLLGNVSGSVFSMSGHPGISSDDAPAHLRFEHNSVFTSSASGSLVLVDLNRDDTRVSQQGLSDDIKVYNNIVSAPAGATVSAISNPDGATNVVHAGNLVQQSYPGWVTEPPVTADDFALELGSAAIGAGSDSAGAIYDYAGESWMNTKRDVGAVQWRKAA